MESKPQRKKRKMSKELETMVKLEAILEEVELSEPEMQRVCDWLADKFDPELNKKETDPSNPFARETIVIDGSLPPQTVQPPITIYPVIPLPFGEPSRTSDPYPWQTYQTWCSDNCGGSWTNVSDHEL